MQPTRGYDGLHLSSRSLRLSSSRSDHSTTFPVTVKHANLICGNLRRLAGALGGTAYPPCRPPRRCGSSAEGRAGRAARCRPCSGSTPPRHDRELLTAITMRVRLRARRAVRSTAPECPALPSPRRAVAIRLQPSPNRAGRPCAALCFRYPPSPASDPQML